MEHITTTEVLEWASDFLRKAEQEISEDERKEQKKYAILIQNPNDKTLLSKMLDESSQIRDSRKLAKRMKQLIDQYGVPSFFNSTDAFLLKLFTTFGYWFDFISVPIFKYRLRADTSKVIINEKASFLTRHLSTRQSENIGQNVNLLGEVVLGDGEANHRYHHYLEALTDPKINYISIKISGIYAQINPLNYAQNKVDLCERLAAIYRQAIQHPYVDEKGVASPKFVNLDMEEYKDTELTLDVFKTVLSQPEFKQYTAGIVVQAYLPDAWLFQSELLEFAHKRVDEGGAPLKMRLVKGANLQMESIVSSLKGWPNPVLSSKVEVDANYLHVLDRALLPENAKVLHVGVASHNFFSIGYAYLLSQKNNVTDYVTFEMLEGMANHLPRVFRHLDRQIILYTPVVKNEHFLNAVSYLVRRMDENTGKENFLSYSFNLTYDSKQWNYLKNQFLEAFALKDSMEGRVFRQQDRRQPQQPPIDDTNTFKNEPDTNFDLKANRQWADEIRQRWMKHPANEPYHIPIQVGDKTFTSARTHRYMDRSQTEEVCVCEASLSNLEQVQAMVETAVTDASGWRQTPLDERNRILHAVAMILSNNRGDLIGCMSAITGKTFLEGDVEVSEAIDFCRFYPISMQSFEELKTVSIKAKGVILVIPPWNFPLAIPVGGVAASLAAGNSVILKPATVALPVAWAFAQCFWEAGVPKDALQVVCTDGREPLNYLTKHPAIRHIILTGGTDTAFRLLKNNPTCPLSAETGGKNAIILTASGDRDHAIQNVVTSAFGNAGQKCSACSLFLVEKSVYNDPDFKAKLHDAVTSLQTGSAWKGGTIVGPMITNENDKLLHAIEHLEPGESWLVAPEFLDERRYILKPCVKWGVKPDSYTFRNELFGPLLAVVCIENLKEGVELMNASEYGLTAGLQSLDEKEQAYWKFWMQAGNLYINRGITGAIVNRQPFGGMKRSAFGGGIKAGGPNYVSCFVDVEELPVTNTTLTKRGADALVGLIDLLEFLRKRAEPKVRSRLYKAVNSYAVQYDKVFSVEKDINNLMGERNTFRYLSVSQMVLRLFPHDTLEDALMVMLASAQVRTPMALSMQPGDPKYMDLRGFYGRDVAFKMESDEEFLASMGSYDRIRTCSPDIPKAYYEKAAELGMYIATAKPVVEGRLEMLHYLKEQSISFEYHRYGSITEEPASSF